MDCLNKWVPSFKQENKVKKNYELFLVGLFLKVQIHKRCSDCFEIIVPSKAYTHKKTGERKKNQK